MTFDFSSPSNGTGDGAQAPASGAEASEPDPLADWRRAHDALLVQERAFAQLVRRVAKRQAAREELQRARLELQAHRTLTDAVLQRALGLPAGAPKTDGNAA